MILVMGWGGWKRNHLLLHIPLSMAKTKNSTASIRDDKDPIELQRYIHTTW